MKATIRWEFTTSAAVNVELLGDLNLTDPAAVRTLLDESFRRLCVELSKFETTTKLEYVESDSYSPTAIWLEDGIEREIPPYTNDTLSLVVDGMDISIIPET